MPARNDDGAADIAECTDGTVVAITSERSVEHRELVHVESFGVVVGVVGLGDVAGSFSDASRIVVAFACGGNAEREDIGATSHFLFAQDPVHMLNSTPWDF